MSINCCKKKKSCSGLISQDDQDLTGERIEQHQQELRESHLRKREKAEKDPVSQKRKDDQGAESDRHQRRDKKKAAESKPQLENTKQSPNYPLQSESQNLTPILSLQLKNQLFKNFFQNPLYTPRNSHQLPQWSSSELTLKIKTQIQSQRIFLRLLPTLLHQMSQDSCLTEKALCHENQLIQKGKRNLQNQNKSDSQSQIHRQLWGQKQKVCFQKGDRDKQIFIQKCLTMSQQLQERQNRDS